MSAAFSRGNTIESVSVALCSQIRITKYQTSISQYYYWKLLNQAKPRNNLWSLNTERNSGMKKKVKLINTDVLL